MRLFELLGGYGRHTRYWMRLRRIRRGRRLYMLRLYLWGGWMLNWIRLPDDGFPHNHPARRCHSRVLLGWYQELRVVTRRRRGSGAIDVKRGELLTHRMGSARTFSGRQYHQIVRLSRGGVLTLFRLEGLLPSRDWGFLVDGQHIPETQHKR